MFGMVRSGILKLKRLACENNRQGVLAGLWVGAGHVNVLFGAATAVTRLIWHSKLTASSHVP